MDLKMKNKLFVYFAIFFILGFVLVGCPNGTTDDDKKTKFDGTWEASTPFASDNNCQIEFNQNNWVVLFEDPRVNLAKGSCTFTENTFQIIQTHLWEDDQWIINSEYLTWEYNLINDNTLDIISVNGNTDDGLVGTYIR
jgi:hypothetical protein